MRRMLVVLALAAAGAAGGSVRAQTPDSAALNSWGIDVLVSNGGFGLGAFYRREITPDLHGFVSFSVSESKEGQEIERYDPYTRTSVIPGKLNRFLVLPLTVGVQRRLFREDIMDTFRPYLNAGVGPTMIFATPFAEITPVPGGVAVRQVEFFRSLGRGQPHYTGTAFLGAGAHFGSDDKSLFGLNFRYYFTYLFGEGLPSLYDGGTGEVAARKKEFGGFFITLNVGLVY